MQPFKICFYLIPIILLLGLIAGNDELTIQLYDTYYVYSYYTLTLSIVVLLAIFGLTYKNIHKQKITSNFRLVKFHLLFSVIGFLILMFIAVVTGGFKNDTTIDMDLKYSYSFIAAIILSIFSVLLGLILFLINIIPAFANNEKDSR